MKKVLTMTLNPCIDRTIYFDKFQVGGTNIVKRIIEEAAGKGINVAVGLQHLQIPVKAMGFAYKEDLTKLYGKLEAENIPYRFVEVEGRLRVNQKLFDESKAEMTECNEKGCAVDRKDIEVLLAMLQEELQETSVLVLSGSVPPGVDKDIYARMISIAKKMGVKVILDASGELLKEGVKAGPYLIKPNKEEFEKTFLEGEESKNRDTCNVEQIATDIIKLGVNYICLSQGGDGAMLMHLPWEENGESSDELIIEKRSAISVPIRSLQGAGDAMVAGLCKAIYKGEEDRMLEYAMTMAASTIMLEGTAMGYGSI